MFLFKRVALLLGSIFICLLLGVFAVRIAHSSSEHISYDTPHEPGVVRIGPHYLQMPVGRILVIRKGQSFGAVKFIKTWDDRSKLSQYAIYESWYQDDNTGDFLNTNAIFKTEKASSILYGIGRFSFNFGNEEVRCGSLRFLCLGNTILYFYGKDQEPGDYGVEFAPTKWTDIKEVNALDPRLKWYKYEKNRPRTDTLIDKLW